jgi:hypothetical protein
MASRLKRSALRSGISGLSGAATPPLEPPPIGIVPPKLGVIQRPGKITFTLNGVPRWLIDVSRFAGTPTLTIQPGPTESRLTLSGARLPGTGLPADFVLLIGKTSPLGTTGAFTFTLGGFHGEVILENWLAGLAFLQSPVTLSGDICPLGASSKLAFTANGEARFSPDWLMKIGGPGVATISGLGPAIPSDTLTLRLLGPTDPTISQHPKTKRTLLAMPAGGHIWTLTPTVTSLPIGNMAVAPGLFTAISIEAGEGIAGDTARELLASSPSVTGLTLAVAGDSTDLDGNPLSLSLASPSYAIAFDDSPDHSQGDQTILSARFAPTPAWLVVDGFALLVGDSPASPGFDVETLKGTVTSLSCEPALITAAAPLHSAAGSRVATEPLELINAVLPFVTAPGAAPGWGIIAGPEVLGRRRFSLPDFSVSVLRREDLLALDFQFTNLALEAGGGTPPQLVLKDSTQPAFLAAQFDSPQNIAEQAYLESCPDTSPPHQPPPPGTDPQSLPDETPGSSADLPTIAQARAAGPSRLVFQLPAGTNSLPYSLDGLLNWVPLEQSVVPVAQAPDPNQTGVPEPAPPATTPQIRQPLATETGIEAPWHLFLSPNYSGAWAHSPTPVTLAGRTELWHTRLAVRTQQNGKSTADETIPRRIRAVWSTDYTPGAIPSHAPPLDPLKAPFRMSLDPNDRDQIVRLSSDFTMFEGATAPHPYVPISIPTEKLYLSTLGAWVDVLGDWPEPLPFTDTAVFSVEQWQHRAAMARDNYVRVVYAGNYLPFGNDAALVKVTERKAQSIAGGPTTAYLRQRFFLITRQPTISYASLTDAQKRNMPYQSITITTLVTPDIVPQVVPGPDGLERYAFFPTVGGNPFLFHIIGTDWEGNTSEFSAPLYFVERGGDYVKAVQAYNISGTGTRPLSGQKIAFAPPHNPGDTSLQTSTLTFSAQPAAPLPTEISPFFPQMDAADVVVPAIQQLTGGSGEMPLQYFSGYLTNGMDPTKNPGEVFAQKTGTPQSVGFNGKQSGGVATPNLTVSGLSRKFGTVSGSDPSNVAQGNFNPADIFQDAGAKLFGVVKISDLLDKVAGLADPNTAPILVTNRLPSQITTTLSFSPLVSPTYSALGGFILLKFNGDLTKALALNATIVMPLTGGGPQVTIHGELNNFTLSLANVIGITIDQIAFDAPAGQKLTVTASMPPTSDNGPIQFLGDLSFLNALQKFIPSNGFQDPPSLDVSSDGITAGYSLPFPEIGLGLFSITNASISAALTLPFFTPNPIRFRFAFCERQHPFNITVSLLGGGGFFGITVGPDGVEILEASIEVGANVSISVVVASGNVHIMAGVYLKYDMVGTSSQLTGYLRAGGSLDVLGLISASVEFYLGFTYFFGPPCSIAGEATVTIEVHVLLFSASVSATLRREFGDPPVSFADLIGPADWDYYCDSFAA